MSKFLNALLFSGMLFISCSENAPQKEFSLIPYPNQLTNQKGEFKLSSSVKLNIEADEQSAKIIHDFIRQIERTSEIKFLTDSDAKATATISFIKNPALAKEEYKIDVNSSAVVVESATANGLFYALLTLKQMLPVAVYGNQVAVQENWVLPCVQIQDKPRFEYRGMHLDVARHFFTVEEIKRYIDIMAAYKLNKFHWHLTDDQGWRIEIKKYPKLTEVGGMRSKTVIRKEWGNYDNKPYGGYYTQDQIREVIRYANERFITVIPEIDLPGHMKAALASYPTLGCTEKNYEVACEWGVIEDVLCIGKESTFEFIENVLTEVIDLFPSEYIHIGGDECPKVRWEKCPVCQKKIKELGIVKDENHKPEHYLQSYAISRVEKFVNSKGRRIIGWDEILEGGLAPDATLMSWRGMDGGIAAAHQGHDVIMTPSSHLYFDHYQTKDNKDKEPFSIGGCSSVARVYSFEPVPAELTTEESKHILGVQANLWTEYIPTESQLEYQLLPRMAALSEIQWSNPIRKNWKRFLNNLERELKMYDLLGYNYAKHIYEIHSNFTIHDSQKGIKVDMLTMGDSPIYYTTDGSYPTENSMRYTSPVLINESCTFNAITKRDNKKTNTLTRTFKFNKATGNQISYNNGSFPKYADGGADVLVDGMRGIFNYTDGCWLGYKGNPLDVNISFYENTEISTVKIGSLVQFAEHVFPPSKLAVYVEMENGEFKQLGQTVIPMPKVDDKDGIYEFACEFPAIRTHKLRVVAEPVSAMPEWHPAHEIPAFVFVDEIIAE